jgi:hypothetical protein
LVELLVVVSIMVIITTIALLGQTSFNRSLVLTDTAYTVAFSVREAQALGISSRTFASTQNAGYGVHFASGGLSSYSLFADISPAAAGNVQTASICPGHVVGSGPEAKPGDCIQTVASEIVRTYTFNSGFKVKSFCGIETSSSLERCNGYLDTLDILYLRPNTQSVVTGVRSGTRVPLSDATIRIQSPDGTVERCVYISRVGQVSVHTKGETECP